MWGGGGQKGGIKSGPTIRMWDGTLFERGKELFKKRPGKLDRNREGAAVPVIAGRRGGEDRFVDAEKSG